MVVVHLLLLNSLMDLLVEEVVEVLLKALDFLLLLELTLLLLVLVVFVLVSIHGVEMVEILYSQV